MGSMKYGIIETCPRGVMNHETGTQSASGF